METQQQLLKLFAQSLKSRANNAEAAINPQLLRHLSRRDLIHIIKDLSAGNLPKEVGLIEMENEALLKLIDNDLAIISYMTAKWCKQEQKLETSKLTSVKKEEVKLLQTKNHKSRCDGARRLYPF